MKYLLLPITVPTLIINFLCLNANSYENLPLELKWHISSYLPEDSLIKMLGVNTEIKHETENYIKSRYAADHFSINNTEGEQSSCLQDHVSYQAIKKACEIAGDIEISLIPFPQFIRYRIGISFLEGLNAENRLRLRLKYLKFIKANKLDIKGDNNLLSRWIREGKARLKKTLTPLSFAEAKQLTKLFLQSGQNFDITSLLSPWMSHNISEMLPEAQYFFFKIGDAPSAMGLFAEEKSGKIYLKPWRRYHIIKALALSKGAGKLEYKAKFQIGKILSHLESIESGKLSEKTYLLPSLDFSTELTKWGQYGKRTFVNNDQITNYYKNFIINPYHNVSISNFQAIIVDEDINISPNSNLTVKGNYLKIKGNIELGQGSQLNINAAFVRIEGTIKGEGELVLKGEKIAFDDKRLRESFVSWEWLKAAAEENRKAQYKIAKMYLKGKAEEADIKDIGQAHEWLKKSALQGYAKAQNQLAYLYFIGDINIDRHTREEKALFWWSKAAVQHKPSVLAQYNLGVMYEQGRAGLPKEESDQQALLWYKMAANQGLAIAQNNLKVMHEQGRVGILPQV
ncbi:MAG: sel1 repeat family protein [Candidatus Paracaedibacteraceae bacterium]|nr:sel1 repeat family protein [Candidatus Paracaedibacteraceae bacterium]